MDKYVRLTTNEVQEAVALYLNKRNEQRKTSEFDLGYVLAKEVEIFAYQEGKILTDVNLMFRVRQKEPRREDMYGPRYDDTADNAGLPARDETDSDSDNAGTGEGKKGGTGRVPGTVARSRGV